MNAIAPGDLYKGRHRGELQLQRGELRLAGAAISESGARRRQFEDVPRLLQKGIVRGGDDARRDVATGVELHHEQRAARLQSRQQLVEEFVGDALVGEILVAEAIKVKLQRPEIHDARVGNIYHGGNGEVRIAGHRVFEGQLRQANLHVVVALRLWVGEVADLYGLDLLFPVPYPTPLPLAALALVGFFGAHLKCPQRRSRRVCIIGMQQARACHNAANTSINFPSCLYLNSCFNVFFISLELM